MSDADAKRRRDEASRAAPDGVETIDVLLVEDEETDREALERFVRGRKLPYRLEAVASLAEARRALAARSFDAIIADLNLGDGTGLDLLLERPRCPVVMLTGGGDEESAAAAIRSGAYDYLVKESDSSHLELLDGTIARARAQWRADRMEDLRAADLARSHSELEKFSRTIAYALSNPLRQALAACTELAPRIAKLGEAEAGERVREIRGAVERAQSLVRDLVDYAALTRSSEPLQRIDAGEIVEDVLDEMGDEIRRRKVAVHVADLPVVYGRERQIRLLFHAIIANAVAFASPVDPVVEIGAENGASFARFRIADNGSGVPAGDRKRIFELFRRRGTDAQRGSNGIGLAMAQRIVEIHGGEIGVASEARDGAVFTFTLPARIDLDERTSR